MDASLSKIVVGPTLDFSGAVALARRLRSAPPAGRYEIDFSAVRWVKPSGALIASRELVLFAQQKGNERVRASNYDHLSYAAHIGFFRAAGIPFGKSPGEAAGGDGYIPIEIQNVPSLRSAASGDQAEIGDGLEQIAKRLSKVLIQDRCEDASEALSGALRELFRNIVEHSDSEQLAYAAQYWPGARNVELAVLDSGLGLRATLTENPAAIVSTDADVLYLACMPGVTRRTGVARKSAANGFNTSWSNKGYGLYMTSRIARSTGDFLLASGESGIALKGRSCLETAWGLSGTFVRVRIGVDEIRNYAAQLERFRKDAHVLVQRLGREATYDAVNARTAVRSLYSNGAP